MKKYLTCFIALTIAIAASSFTSVKMNTVSQQTALGYKWFDFHGGLLEMCDPYYYALDYNNIPECPPSIGLIYCEILALPSEYDPAIPDLTTIVGSRMRSLL